jgi:hypothetical protein
MGFFEKMVVKPARDFLQKRKKLIIILTLSLGLLVGLNLVLKRYMGSVVSSLVKEFVQEKSMGFYEVDFEEIALVLNAGQFYMSEFTFDIHPDYRDNIDYENFKEDYIYTAKIPRLQIDIDNFWSVLVKKELSISGIEITAPFIKIINLNKDKKPKKISLEAGNLYEVMSEHLKELEVNDFLIADGEFDYEAYKGPDYDNFKIKGLTFEVNNFQVNKESDSRTDKFFYTDDISLQIKDQLLYLKDSIHKVTFDKFYISTSNNEFGFENFNLTRRQDAAINVKTHDHYEISIPILRLSGIDFLAAYNNNLLIIDSVQILDPMINIKKRTKSQQDSTRNGLMDVAMIYNEYLKVDHFNFENANLIFTDATKQQAKQYSIDQISAHITQVEIDAERNSKDQYSFSFDEADLIVKDYEVNLPDSTNTVKFGEFSISSDPFEIKLKVPGPGSKSAIPSKCPVK